MAARSDGPSIVPVADEDLAVGASYRMTFRDGDDGLEAVDIHGRTITRITKTPIKHAPDRALVSLDPPLANEEADVSERLEDRLQ